MTSVPVLTGRPVDAGLAAFRAEVDHLVDTHPVVVDNVYTQWFAAGEATVDEVRHLTVQFSVFSHLFMEAALRKVLNAPTIEAYHAGKEILLNELGVVFRPARAPTRPAGDDVDPELVSTEGSVEGGRFRFGAAHFEWLLRFGEPLGLGFADLGKRRLATPATRLFCEELLRWYGSVDVWEAEGASYAVEHWAAAGFWKELIGGLQRFADRAGVRLPLAFWTWHDKVEDQHAGHTEAELAELYGTEGFDRSAFLRGAAHMLDGVQVFWDGLETDRRAGRLHHLVDRPAEDHR